MLKSLIIRGRSATDDTFLVEYVIDTVENLTGSKFTVLGIKGISPLAIQLGVINKIGYYDILDFIASTDLIITAGGTQSALYLLDKKGKPKLIHGDNRINGSISTSIMNFNTYPGGWIGSGNTVPNNNTNPSSGYSGASGGFNVKFSDVDSTGNFIISSQFSTLGADSVKISWGARGDSSGIYKPSLSYTINNGVSVLIPFTPNVANNTWALENGGIQIDLPVLANKSNIHFLFQVGGGSTEKNYYIDDFKLTCQNFKAFYNANDEQDFDHKDLNKTEEKFTDIN